MKTRLQNKRHGCNFIINFRKVTVLGTKFV